MAMVEWWLVFFGIVGVIIVAGYYQGSVRDRGEVIRRQLKVIEYWKSQCNKRDSIPIKILALADGIQIHVDREDSSMHGRWDFNDPHIDLAETIKFKLEGLGFRNVTTEACM